MVRQSESSTTTRRPPPAISLPSCCETAAFGLIGNAVERTMTGVCPPARWDTSSICLLRPPAWVALLQVPRSMRSTASSAPCRSTATKRPSASASKRSPISSSAEHDATADARMDASSASSAGTTIAAVDRCWFQACSISRTCRSMLREPCPDRGGGRRGMRPSSPSDAALAVDFDLGQDVAGARPTSLATRARGAGGRPGGVEGDAVDS